MENLLKSIPRVLSGLSGKGDRPMDFYDKLRVLPGAKVNLGRIDPAETFGWNDKEAIKAKLAENSRKLLALQYKLFAENKQSLLIVLQAMDAGGKDGVINHVLYAMNPQGCRCHSFKVPTALEASHDFLWREHAVAPHNGEVVIFNRSHYEAVLVERVHGEIEGQALQRRFDYINCFESILSSNHTAILKFYLHISKEEQFKRFGERLNDPAKHWKISESDYRERDFWDDYMNAFNDALTNCSTDYAPWFVIPANNKEFRNIAVSDIIIRALETMNPQVPDATVDVEQIRRLYMHDEVAAAVDPAPVVSAPAPVPISDPPADDPGEKSGKKNKDGKKRKKHKK